MDLNEPARPELMIACRHDAADLADLARRRMPDMPALHALEGWAEYYRFGPGFHPRDNFLLVVRIGGDGPLIGFSWVDAAMRTDSGITEPWWCINAVAVDERVAGRGLGSELVGLIKQQATDVGVTSLYGLCYPSSAAFWRKRGFDVGALGQGLRATAPVGHEDGTRTTFSMSGEAGNHLFSMEVGDTSDGRPRLTLAEPAS